MQVLKDLLFHHTTLSRGFSHEQENQGEDVKQEKKDHEQGVLHHETIKHPNDTTHSHKPTLHFGVSRAMGSRDHQEDEYTCIDNLSAGKGSAYFAIFDGHGGDLFSSYSSSHLHQTIFESDSFKAGNYDEAIREGIIQEDKELFEKYKEQRGGSTATVCIITENKLYLGNVGDSRAVLAVKEGDELCAKRISRDHKPDDADEKARINKAGGVVWQGRVRGTECAINMSRAIGDFAHKAPLNNADADWIASEPFIATPVTLSPAVKFIVLASDGLWDVASDEKVVQAVSTMYLNGETPDEIAKELTNFCANKPLADNTTVLVVFFDFEGHQDTTDEAAGKVVISQHQSR